MSYEKRSPRGLLRNLAKLPESLFYLSCKLGLKAATLLKKRLWHRCFPVNFAKFVRILFFQNTPVATSVILRLSWSLGWSFYVYCLCDVTEVETLKQLAVVNAAFLPCYGECVRVLFLPCYSACVRGLLLILKYIILKHESIFCL